MEIHSATTRFTLICNYVSRIIDPIASRCSKFRFKTLAGEHAGGRLEEIAEKENVQYENGVIEKLLAVSEGDMRRAVTYLQSSYNLTSAAATASTKAKRAKKIVGSDDSEVEMTDAPPIKSAPVIVTIRTVEEVAGVIPASVIQDLVSAMQPSKRGPIYDVVSNQVTNMVADGWSANQILAQLYTVLVADETLDARKKVQIFAIFSEVDKRLVDGSEESLAILDLALRLAAVLRDGK
jgi:replication factor C subunit 2/4